MYLSKFYYTFCVFLSLCLYINLSQVIEPDFPLQFSGNLVITSHLIDKSSEFPPQKRRLSIVYDYINKRARVELEAGYEAAKYFIRRYDTKNDYQIRLPPINDCKRSYLGETMPFPDLSAADFVKQETVNDILCNYFLFTDSNTRVHIYLAVEDNAPVKLFTEYYDQYSSKAIMTYEYSDVYVGEVDESWFQLPSPYDGGVELTDDNCPLLIGGFPYIHIFHHLIRV